MNGYFYTIKSRALGEVGNNTTFQNESRGEGESSGEILPEIKENLRIYLDCPGAKVQMSVKERGGKGSFISEGI